MNEEIKKEPCCSFKISPRDSFFWALLLISLGLIFLLNSLHVISLNWNFLVYLFNFWPLLLILFGLNILLGKSVLSKWVLLVISSFTLLIVICLALSASSVEAQNFFHGTFPWWPVSKVWNSSSELLHQTFTVSPEKYPLTEVTKRELEVDLGISEFTITDNENENYYLELNSDYFSGFGEPILTDSLKNKILALDFQTESSSPFALMNFPSINRTRYDFTLGESALPTDLLLNLGTGKGTVTLTKTPLRNLSIDVGTGSLNLNLSANSLPSEEIVADLGTGKISFQVPSDTGLKIKYDLGVGSVKVDHKKLDDENEIYYSENYQKAEHKLEFDLNIGTGSFEITRE